MRQIAEIHVWCDEQTGVPGWCVTSYYRDGSELLIEDEDGTPDDQQDALRLAEAWAEGHDCQIYILGQAGERTLHTA